MSEMDAAMLAVKGLRSGYHGVEVLKGIDLDVRKGEFVAIMGPSGSGKTTLLDVIGGLLKPTSGEVRIGGTSLKGLSDSELARIRGRRIGFIFQQHTGTAPQVTLDSYYISHPCPYHRLCVREGIQV